MSVRIIFTNIVVILFAISTSEVHSEESDQESIKLVITGNLMGTIRECFCKHGQPGGLARRKTIFDELRLGSDRLYFVDCGDRLANDMTDDEITLLDSLYRSLNYDVVLNSPGSLHRLDDIRGDFEAIIRNLQSLESYEEIVENNSDETLIIIGGGGYVDTEVIKSGKTLVAFPGLQGEYVLIIDLWIGENGIVKEFNWHTIPTISAAPNMEFEKRIVELYSRTTD